MPATGTEGRLLDLVEKRLAQRQVPLALRLWNGRELRGRADPAVTVHLRSRGALLPLARPNLGRLAQAYVDGAIDLEGDFRDVLRAGEALSEGPRYAHHAARRWAFWRHTRTADRRNIERHYDLGNDFYGLWLDANRVYSCAYFRTGEDSLDLAQEQKLDHICRKLRLRPGERFLDIGCGWGGLVTWAARHYGVSAIGVTLSEAQCAYARARVAALGLQERCEIRLLDYRDIPEGQPFDKIASVGMFEHVGRAQLPTYFRKIRDLLRPGGLVLNHGITTNSLEGGELASGMGDFVERYVFPGGELQHVHTVIGELAAQGLELWDAECLRPHYARTLWHWVDRLQSRQEEARALVGERVLRIWLIYMAGSAHAFSRGWISLFQLLAVRPEDDGSVPYPLTREHLYAGRP